jgi:hypothetical protein
METYSDPYPQYPVITIRDQSQKETKPARQVTRHLAVSNSNRSWDRDTFKVFSVMAENPAIWVRFTSMKDAIEVALFLEALFGDYWAIHDHLDWRDVSIPMIARHSVPEGDKVYDAIAQAESSLYPAFAKDIIKIPVLLGEPR